MGYVSISKDHVANPPKTFLTILFQEDIQSLKLLGLSLANHISKLASKASHGLGILHRTNSFLGTPELLSTYKDFICILMEYCSSFWAGTPATHLAQLDAMDPKAFKSIGISCDEAEATGLLHSQSRQVGYLSVIYHLLCGLALCFLSHPRFLQGTQGSSSTTFW